MRFYFLTSFNKKIFNKETNKYFYIKIFIFRNTNNDMTIQRTNFSDH